MTGMISRRGALVGTTALALSSLTPAAAWAAGEVVITEDADTFTLTNGIILARVSKATGDLISLVFKGVETLSAQSGHPYAYWSHDTAGGAGLVARMTIDPATNGGARGEVSVKGVSGGKAMGRGPGAPATGDIPADIEIRYCLGRGEQGVYTYCIFDHPPEYGGATMAEARFAAKLSSFFTDIHIDDLRSGRYPLLNEGTDKYVYTTLQARHRAYGFTSPERKIGWFMLITSPEYLSGGPTKPEFLAHGTNPTVLSYWKSSHYSGANVTVAKGEAWSRVVGPFMLYVNEGPTPQAMWDDAKAKLVVEERQWPYDWVRSPAFTSPRERGGVRGRLVLSDPLAPPGAGFSGELSVGLSRTPYEIPQGAGTRTITWQNDGKFYQFWSHNRTRDGRFSITNVVPGTYTLHAFADGVLGEFARARVTVNAGQTVDLGRLEWTPARRGRQLWEIGTPNRTATEFRYADRYFEPGIALRYAELFPNDVTFRPGRSDPSRDWFFAHGPHNNDPQARVVEFRGVLGTGRATPYRIQFAMPGAGRGRATLRLAICATGPRTVLDVTVNGADVGRITLGPDDGALTRHQIQGRWYELEHSFDGAMLRPGENELILTAPAGPLTAGVVYDYLRLELDDEGGDVDRAPKRADSLVAN